MVTDFSNESGGRLFIEYLVSDDDSSLRSHLRHAENGGKLAANVPELSFLADPSHRIKTMCSPIYKMITNTKDPSKCKKIDFFRVKKYTSCYIYQNRNKPLDDFVKCARAPIEHLFNLHEWYNPEWCRVKSLIETQRNDVTCTNIAQTKSRNMCTFHRRSRNIRYRC